MSEILDRIHVSLIGLRMPRALEALEHTMRTSSSGARSPRWRPSTGYSARSM